jgi:glycosyltransferase involved in cell wall biosynthesis
VRLAILTSHPIQYQAPLFRALAARPSLELKVFFCWDFGVKATRDPGFGQSFVWDIPLLTGYEHEFLRNVSPRPGTDWFFGLVNPDAARRVHDYRPQAVVVHGYSHLTENVVIQASRSAGIPVLLRGESNLLRQRPALVRVGKRLALPLVMSRLAGALAIGTHNARYLEHYGVPRERIFLTPYAVDNAFFREQARAARTEARAWRAKLDIPSDHLVVLFVAKLIPEKACADLIRAMGSLRRRDVTLVIAGDGPLRTDTEALAAGYPGLSTRFLGFANQTRMPAVYALGDLLVLPSLSEPWGLVVNEAMNLGLPVIVSDQVGAAPDLVSSANGWVFPAGDIPALTAALREAISDRTALKRRGEASRARIAEWDIHHTVAGFERALEAVSQGGLTAS